MTEPATSSVPHAGPAYAGIEERHAALMSAAHLAEARAKAAETALEYERGKSETALKAAQAEREAAVAEKEKIASESVAAQRRTAVIQAATELNARDPKDILALLPADAVKQSANGEFVGLTEAIKALATEKPWLFKTASSSDTGSVPNPKGMGDKPVADMTEAEWKSARARIVRGA